MARTTLENIKQAVKYLAKTANQNFRIRIIDQGGNKYQLLSKNNIELTGILCGAEMYYTIWAIIKTIQEIKNNQQTEN